MRRHSHELALAAGIFIAANAVYGVEALIGRDPGNTNGPMDVRDVDSGYRLAMRIEENSRIRIPGEFIWKLGADELETSLCVRDDSGNNHPHTFSVDPSFNYDLSLEKDPHDPGLILECGDEGKVILKISIDSNADDLLQRDMANRQDHVAYPAWIIPESTIERFNLILGCCYESNQH